MEEPKPVIKRLGERVGAEALPNEAEAIARLRQTIENAQGIIEEEKRRMQERKERREALQRELAEIKLETQISDLEKTIREKGEKAGFI